MRTLLLQLIGIALVQLLVMFFSGSEQMMRFTQLIGTAAMVTLLLSHVLGFDYAAYAAAMQAHPAAQDFRAEDAQALSDRLDRMLIESGCRAYILDKAASVNAQITDAAVTCSWSTDGYWYPTEATITIPQGAAPYDALSAMIEAELGVDPARITWKEADAP